MPFSIYLTDEEKKLIKSYAEAHGITISRAFKNALFERIEDEIDAKIGEEAYKEYISDGCQAKPWDADEDEKGFKKKARSAN